MESREAATENKSLKKSYLLSVIAIAPSGLDTLNRAYPRLTKPRLGLNSDRCSAALLNGHSDITPEDETVKMVAEVSLGQV